MTAMLKQNFFKNALTKGAQIAEDTVVKTKRITDRLTKKTPKTAGICVNRKVRTAFLVPHKSLPFSVFFLHCRKEIGHGCEN